MTRAPGKRTADSAITRSLILSAIEAGATYAQAGRDANVSPARARQIAKEAGLPPRHPGGPRSTAVTPRTARGEELLAYLCALADAAGEDPLDWLEDAARCRKACEHIAAWVSIAADVDDPQPSATVPRAMLAAVLAAAIGPSDTSAELAEQVRAAVGTPT